MGRRPPCEGRGHRAAAKVEAGAGSMAGMDMSGTGAAGGLASDTGAAPANADALAAAHEPFPAELPAAPAGPVANVNLVLKDVTVQIAPRRRVLGVIGERVDPVEDRPDDVEVGVDRRSGVHDPETDELTGICRQRMLDVLTGVAVEGHPVGLASVRLSPTRTTRFRNVQTVTVPAGGGGVFDVAIDQPGLYPFVSHAFAAVDEGQVGLLKVGDVKGTMSH
jgi:hypothetical protein